MGFLCLEPVQDFYFLQKNQLVTAFHPELNDDISVHKYFINIIEGTGTKR